MLLPAGWESEEVDLLRRAAAGERVAPFTTYRVRRDGTIIAVVLTMSPIVSSAGEIVGVVSTARLLPAGSSSSSDLQVPHEDREQLQAQFEQAQRLEVLGQLAGGVAHDFNNLLAVILNYAAFVVEELARTAAGPGQTLQAACETSDRSSGPPSAPRADPASFSPSPAVRSSNRGCSISTRWSRRWRNFSAVPSARTWSCITELAENLWPILADPGQIEQVLVNLAINARDAMPDGGTLIIDTAM